MDSAVGLCQGKRPVAVVTGGLRGLGLGVACQLLEDGFNVAIIDLQEDSTLPDELIDAACGVGEVKFYALDISDVDKHEYVLSSVLSDFGRLDCLVNNAGIAARPLTDVLDLDVVAFKKSLDVNLKGTFFLTQTFAKKMLSADYVTDTDYRSIIFITSIAAEIVSTDRSQYCISKSALSMATKIFAKRLASENIYVHEVRPGFMKTDMTASVGNETIENLLHTGFVPIPRWGLPQDVARTVSTLASGGMPYMTGQPIWIAGGLNIATKI